MNDERTLQEAARRHARLQAVDCTNAERDQIRAWQEESATNSRASELAERVIAGTDRMSADEQLGLKLKALADEALAAYSPSTSTGAGCARRRWKIGLGVAASLAAAMIAWHVQPHSSSRAAAQVAYETGSDHRRAVTLDDGTVVELDVATRITVHITQRRREVELLSGRALFDVAHDSSRPFSVSASGSRTTALGTQFQVHKQDRRIVVTLAEGSVAVDTGKSASWQERLSPGEQLTIDTQTTQRSRQMVDSQLATSWSHGRHVFRGTPLREALDEVNRYAARKVRLGDSSLGELPVAGNFIAGDSDVVVEAFAAVLPLRVVHSGDREIILFRRYRE